MQPLYCCRIINAVCRSWKGTECVENVCGHGPRVMSGLWPENGHAQIYMKKKSHSNNSAENIWKIQCSCQSLFQNQEEHTLAIDWLRFAQVKLIQHLASPNKCGCQEHFGLIPNSPSLFGQCLPLVELFTKNYRAKSCKYFILTSQIQKVLWTCGNSERRRQKKWWAVISKRGPAWAKLSEAVPFKILNQTTWNTTCWERRPPMQPGKMPACPESSQTITSFPSLLSWSPCCVVI